MIFVILEGLVDRDDQDVNRAPSFIASICLAVAALAVGPFGQASGSDRINASHAADGVELTGADGTPELHIGE